MSTDTNTTPAVVPTVTPRSFTCHDRIERVLQRAKNFFRNDIPAYIDEHIQAALTIADSIRSIIKNPAVEGVLDTLTKGIAAPILTKIEDALDKVIDALEIELACKSCTTFEDKLKCIADQISKREPQLQAALLHAMAVILSKLTSEDVTLTETELSALVAFTENQKAHAANTPTG